MKQSLPDLWPAFFAELTERLGRVRRDLAQAQDAALFDRLHQEFDTLHGAARAVDCVCLERSNRRLAEYARQLRRRDAPPTEGRALLERAVDLGLGCAAHGRCCEDCPSLAAMPELMAELDRALGEKQ
jgi:hypothetical protein